MGLVRVQTFLGVRSRDSTWWPDLSWSRVKIFTNVADKIGDKVGENPSGLRAAVFRYLKKILWGRHTPRHGTGKSLMPEVVALLRDLTWPNKNKMKTLREGCLSAMLSFSSLHLIVWRPDQKTYGCCIKPPLHCRKLKLCHTHSRLNFCRMWNKNSNIYQKKKNILYTVMRIIYRLVSSNFGNTYRSPSLICSGLSVYLEADRILRRSAAKSPPYSFFIL